MSNEIIASIFLSVLSLKAEVVAFLLSHFGSALAAHSAGVDAWEGLISPAEFSAAKEKWGSASVQAENDFKEISKRGMRLLMAHSGPYPEPLRHIQCAPPFLYVRGQDICFDPPAVAIVGSRRCSLYGKKMATQFSEEIAGAGAVIVSGLARGIDSYAHHAALEAGGITWAVVGCGLSTVYPPENSAMADRIAEKGAIISEFPLSTKPLPQNFPRRNRIIAGLTSAMIVIEGTNHSGSLISARLAAEEGREVFALPGPVTSPLSEAPHRLLKDGAHLIQSSEDVFAQLPQNYRDQLKISADDGKNPPPAEYKKLLQEIELGYVTKEILAKRLCMSVAEIAASLTQLEIGGWISSGHGGIVFRN